MVSKRKFFSIATMMFVLFFLFQFSMVLRDSKNTYDINSSLTATLLYNEPITCI